MSGYKVVQPLAGGTAALVEWQLQTGRTHQIRSAHGCNRIELLPVAFHSIQRAAMRSHGVLLQPTSVTGIYGASQHTSGRRFPCKPVLNRISFSEEPAILCSSSKSLCVTHNAVGSSTCCMFKARIC